MSKNKDKTKRKSKIKNYGELVAPRLNNVKPKWAITNFLPRQFSYGRSVKYTKSIGGLELCIFICEGSSKYDEFSTEIELTIDYTGANSDDRNNYLFFHEVKINGAGSYEVALENLSIHNRVVSDMGLRILKKNYVNYCKSMGYVISVE